MSYDFTNRRPAPIALLSTPRSFWLTVVFALLALVLASLDLVALEAYVASSPENLALLSSPVVPFE
jgi:hypothetical protein